MRLHCNERSSSSTSSTDRRLDRSATMGRRRRSRADDAVLMTAVAAVVLIAASSWCLQVDGRVMMPYRHHRKNEIPDDLTAQQRQQPGATGDDDSELLRDVKKAPVFDRRQCNVTEKVDCGQFGIERDECLDRGCCYSEVMNGPAPWCYLPETSLVSECRGREESRLQCGSYGIRSNECLRLGCCWRPTSTDGTPWCYHADTNVTPPGPVPAGNSGPMPAPVGQCGVTPIDPNVNLRIVGGVEAVPHSWPWMASLQDGSGHHCGGSIINSRWILSAAHCHRIFDNLTASSVVVGAHSIRSPDPTYTERFSVEKIVVNEKFLRPDNEISNDIMLIKLARPITFNAAVLPVCLPQPFQRIEPDTTCWATGWGMLESEAESSSDILNQVALPIIDNGVCNQPTWYDGAIDDTMVCAGFEAGGKDSCQGDSGGPLVCYQGDRWIHYGIVSWGHGCAFANKPGLYGRTSAYLKWIRKHIKANSRS